MAAPAEFCPRVGAISDEVEDLVRRTSTTQLARMFGTSSEDLQPWICAGDLPDVSTCGFTGQCEVYSGGVTRAHETKCIFEGFRLDDVLNMQYSASLVKLGSPEVAHGR